MPSRGSEAGFAASVQTTNQQTRKDEWAGDS
jgi:hypothetical protein